MINGSEKLQELFDWARKFTEGQVDDFDIHEAIYWFAADYHGGQGSDLYEALSCSPFQPGRYDNEPNSEDAQQLYGALVAEFVPDSVN